MKSGTVIAILGLIILMFLGPITLSLKDAAAGIVIMIFGFLMFIGGLAHTLTSEEEKEAPPPPPSPPSHDAKTEQYSLEREECETEAETIQELRERVEEYRKELETVQDAYGQLQIKMKKLEDEIKAKDEMINTLKEELEKRKELESIAEAESKRMESLQQSRAPKVRLIAYDTDLAVYDYIIAHGGTINIRKASKDLGLPIEQLKEAIERLKRAGRLTEAS